MTKRIPTMTGTDFWTDEQIQALEAMDKYCANLRKGKEVIGMPAEIYILKCECIALQEKINPKPINQDEALAKQDAYIWEQGERERQRLQDDDFPMDRADRLMFGKVNEACPELCRTRTYTQEQQDWILVEGTPIKESELLARSLTKKGYLGEAKWVRDHAELWDTEQLGEEEPQPIRWVKANGWTTWARLASRPIRLTLGAQLLIALVRTKVVNDQVVFLKLIKEIPELGKNETNRLWNWFELVMFKRNPKQYKAWKARQKSRNMKQL